MVRGNDPRGAQGARGKRGSMRHVWIVEAGDYEQRGIWAVAESVEAAVQSIKDPHEGYTVRWEGPTGGGDAYQLIGHFAGDPGKAIKHDACFDIDRHDVVGPTRAAQHRSSLR